MIKNNWIFISLAILLFLGCKTAKIATNNHEIKNESEGLSNIYRITVSFISKGSGINENLKEKYDQFIIDFGKERNKKLTYSITNWGKEGETDYCFTLTELTSEEQQSFIDESKTILKESDLVIISENVSCRKK